MLLSFPKARVLCNIVRLCWCSSPVHCERRSSIGDVRLKQVQIIILYSSGKFGGTDDELAHSIGNYLHRSLNICTCILLSAEKDPFHITFPELDDNIDTTSHRIYVLIGSFKEIHISILHKKFGVSLITDVFTYSVGGDDGNPCVIQWGDIVPRGPIYFCSTPKPPIICYWRGSVIHSQIVTDIVSGTFDSNDSINLVWCMGIAQSLNNIRYGLELCCSDELLERYFPRRHVSSSSSYGKLVFENSPQRLSSTGFTSTKDRYRSLMEVWTEPTYSSIMEYILVAMKFDNYSPSNYLEHFSTLFRQQMPYLASRGTLVLAMDVLTALVSVYFNALDMIYASSTDMNQVLFRRLSSDLCRNISQLNVIYGITTRYPYIGDVVSGSSSADVALRLATIAATKYPDDIESIATVARFVIHFIVLFCFFLFFLKCVGLGVRLIANRSN